MKLSELKNNQSGIITKVMGRGAFRKRIIEMGFVKGKEITVIKNAPLRDPIEYSIMGYLVSLRRSEASLIEVHAEVDKGDELQYNGVIVEEDIRRIAIEKGKTINVAIVGNPNSGKTTLFNHASGSKEHVGNYSGVTVDAKYGKYKLNGYTYHITDLPGTYSLTAYSPEELFVRNYIINNAPDVVINVLDASNLERNLYLTTQLIDLDIKVVAALNMYDELQEKGDRLDYELLGKMIGIPMIPTVSSKGKGIEQLFEKVAEVFEDKDEIIRHVHINYGLELENSISKIQEYIKRAENLSITDKVSSRFLSLKMLENDTSARNLLQDSTLFNQIEQTAKKKQKEFRLSLTKMPKR
jgi:ferrous iron transport protein B